MAGFTHFTRPIRVWENELVDDDVVCVNAALCQLLDQPLRLIQREELGDTHTDEGGLFLIGVRKARRGEELKHIPIHLYKIHIQYEFASDDKMQ